MSERSDAVRHAVDVARLQMEDMPSGWAKTVKALLDEHERMEEVLDVAREFLSHNGPFIASDGYVSVAVGDSTPLRKALAAFDGFETKPADQPRIYEDPVDVYIEMAADAWTTEEDG